MATNLLGHFALTGLLLAAAGRVRRRPGRAVSSQGHRVARTAPLGDPRVQAGALPALADVRRTKLANLLFTFELDRRARARRAAGAGAGRAPRLHAPPG